MNERSTLDKNLVALHARNPDLADEIARASTLGEIQGFRYSGSERARSGSMVPLYQDGSSAHSLFNPEREAAQLVESMGETGFAFFAGIAGGFHVREFLSRSGERGCVVAESGIQALLSLFILIDLSDIVGDERVTVIDDCASAESVAALGMAYIPALHGNFRLVPLRSWQERNRNAFDALVTSVSEVIEGIRADFSVQAHFGRLWHRNCFMNLALASRAQGRFPDVDAGKKAMVIAAGPGLERRLSGIRAERERLVLFSTDTAWNVLADSGITPDFFLSIDAQSVSASHAMRPFDRRTTIILDVCGNPAIARRAQECGVPALFVAGNHPLARRAARFSPLPLLDTGSGTVTIAALDAARALGFREIETVGADFAYTGGKPYARGTYLAHSFGASALRMNPSETQYSALMFRTPVGIRQSPGTITYTTETLDRYARSFACHSRSTRWDARDFVPFPAKRFIASYRKELEASLRASRPDRMSLYPILPLAAWASRHVERIRSGKPENRDGQNDLSGVIQLALEMIAGYTD